MATTRPAVRWQIQGEEGVGRPARGAHAQRMSDGVWGASGADPAGEEHGAGVKTSRCRFGKVYLLEYFCLVFLLDNTH
jgi:hypothetical protein